MNTLLAKKLSMTQRYDQAGNLKTVTMIEVEPHIVVGKRSIEKDGRDRILVGVGAKRKLTKALLGLFRELGEKVPRWTKEVWSAQNLEIGTTISLAEVLKPGDVVKVSGVSKGKGFTGVVKRHGFAGGPKTHGQSDRHRAPGSVGAGTDPGRVFKGLRMAGRSGGEGSSVRNLTVLHIDERKNVIFVSGPVPGHFGGQLVLERLGENKKFEPLVLLDSDKVVDEVAVKNEERTESESVAKENVAEVKE
jgi:large subunit ribosomal protein L3